MKSVLYTLILFSLFACSDGTSKSISVSKRSVDGQELDINQESVEDKASDIVESLDGIQFKFTVLSAIKYLQKSGRHISSEAVEELKNESVILLTIQTKEANEDIMAKERFQFEDQELNQYLELYVINDLTVTQGKKEFNPSVCKYEAIRTDPKDKMHLAFYVQNINLDKDFTIQFNDKLFQTGLIRKNFTKSSL